MSRIELRKGTVLCFPNDASYKIESMIGQGGSALIYEAKECHSELYYAVKEFYPISGYTRVHGEIVPENGEDRTAQIELEHMKKNLSDREFRISQKASRYTYQVIPERGTFETVDIILPDGTRWNHVRNRYTLMDSLKKKGMTLQSYLNHYDTCFGPMSLPHAIAIMETILTAYASLHQCGFIHGDCQMNNIILLGSVIEQGRGNPEVGIAHIIDFGSSRELINENKTDVIHESLYSTDGYRAPEIQFHEKNFQMMPACDVWALGFLFLNVLIQQDWSLLQARGITTHLITHSRSKRIPTVYAHRLQCDEKTLDFVNEILMRAMANNPEDRYQDAGAMLLDLQLLKQSMTVPAALSGQTERTNPYRLINKLPLVREVFEGRDDLLDTIHQFFQEGKRILFLEGIGGIGKSEVAKNFAIRHKNDYDNILFCSYTSSIRDLVCSPYIIEIEGFRERENEPRNVLFQRKLQVLRTLMGARTLLIIDNYNVNQDPDFSTFTEGSFSLLLTTQSAHPGFPSLPVEAIPSEDVKLNVFEKYYGFPISEEDKPFVKEMIRYVSSHTYAIELLAKQMAVSFYSGEKMLTMLKNRTFANSGMEPIPEPQGSGTAWYHICNIFHISVLNEKEQDILRCLFLMGPPGVKASLFLNWIGMNSFEPIINSLIRRHWIRREEEQRINLHPLVSEVVFYVLKPTIPNCRDFLYRFAQFSFHFWLQNYKINLEIGENILFILNYFSPLDGAEFLLFEPLCSALWQIGKFDDAISFCHQLLQTTISYWGEYSMEAGFVAKALGGCYFNSGQLLESIPWYQKGLDYMVATDREESEDLAMSLEKVGRCYTWEGNQDFEKAESLLQKSLQIRKRLLEKLCQGDTLTCFAEYYQKYDTHVANQFIGECYMEIGRLYQAMGNWDKALRYAMQYKKNIQDFYPNNKLGLAYAFYDEGICHYHRGIEFQKIGDNKGATVQWNQAIDLFHHALSINLQHRGGIAIDSIDVQEALADTYFIQKKVDQAADSYRSAQHMAEILLGKHSLRTQTIEEKLLQCLKKKI